MNTLQLYINDNLVDLSDDAPMALTFQINNLAEVRNQQGNTSNQFKLPLTQRNRRILGFPDEVAFTDDKPYGQYPAKIMQDGLEIIPYGVAELNGIDQDTAAITVLSGNVDFFDAIDGKIYDMGDSKTAPKAASLFKSYEHTWSVANVVASQSHTQGWIWPVVDYGNLVYNPAGQCEVNVRYLRPGFFIKTAIDMMLATAGYTGTGSLLNNPVYPDLIAQFSNSSFDHGTDYQNQPDVNGINVALSNDLFVDHPNVHDPDGMIHWSVNNNPSGHFLAGYVYNAPQDISVTATVTIPKFNLYGRVTDDESSVEISIYVSTPSAGTLDKLVSNIFDFSGGYSEEPGHVHDSGSNKKSDTIIKDTVISASADLSAGQQLAVGYSFHGKTPAWFRLYSGATWEVKTNIKTVQFGQTVQCERIFPDISQKDLLKDVLQKFGIICQTDNTSRTVNFAAFRDIVNNIPVAKNWTGKCLDQGKSISFQLGGYAQTNYMKYKQDDAVLPAGFADSQINVADKTLPATADLFESQFAPTLNRPYIGGTIAQIKMTEIDDENHEFNIGVSPRVLINQKIDLRTYGNASIRFTDGNPAHDIVVNDWVSVPYFYKPDGEHNLCFGNMPGTGKPVPGLKTLYYPELQKILTQTKKVVRYFLLTPRDILELDLLMPIYLEQDSAYYYINKIDSWRKGQPTKIELIKLG
ncbi:hypothetical protein HQ865_01445 [Mucilaginibacter mali]|uniref:Uncharacterized protein n=1 Tax=Mucilaginibacter mali TaxID=2740462 RepID=A0A7D4TVD1_9SPHI|nr:hypothetical protein [Mucilaginibacter mali]QKJ28477.1 hypothetical protein HQ865_01445 [Mucilaginibacter mali]